MMLWDVSAKKRMLVPADFLLPEENASAGSGMAFSPDEKYLAAVYSETVVVWDIANSKAEGVWDIAKSLLGWDVANKGNLAYIHVGGVKTLADRKSVG